MDFLSKDIEPRSSIRDDNVYLKMQNESWNSGLGYVNTSQMIFLFLSFYFIVIRYL